MGRPPRQKQPKPKRRHEYGPAALIGPDGVVHILTVPIRRTYARVAVTLETMRASADQLGTK